MDSEEHWNAVYAAKGDPELSWTQPEPHMSLSLIEKACSKGRVIDIGGGTSNLAARLLERGYSVAVLDISEAALERSGKQLGDQSDKVQWIVADITTRPAFGPFDVWHDRAVFHFLNDPADRAAYKALLLQTVPVGGHAVMATFAPDGPERCSGLEVRRYAGPALAAELGNGFTLLESRPETHETPWGKSQSFQYSLFQHT